jgi:hypothetical protein
MATLSPVKWIPWYAATISLNEWNSGKIQILSLGFRIEVRECLLSFGAESSVVQFAIQIFKDQDIQNYNFARCSVLREERRLRVFENRVLSRVFWPKRDKVTGEWRKLHNEELSDLYSLRNIVRVVKSRRMRWAGHVARMGEGRGLHRVLVGKPERKRPLGRLRHRWENNIR